MKRQFKAESKRLLELMINSIYTHKEIFLRELISNASDAIDKRYFLSLTNKKDKVNRDDLKIEIERDEENRRLLIRDNGIGMDRNSLEDNLGVIARSGSLSFKEEHEAVETEDIIGQFGVGFYSSFMVAEEVTVISRAVGSKETYQWQSKGIDSYTIEEVESADVGTTIILNLKDDTEDENYSDFLNETKIRKLIQTYSDYIRYPIVMEVTKDVAVEGKEDETITEIEAEILNSMVPIWKRDKSEVSEEKYNEFYKNKFNDYMDPLKTIRTSVEGNVSYEALLFIPSHTPYDYYTKEYEKGLQLYSKNVFIMDKASELLPEYFRFVKGLVDSQDLSLNISREMLQHDRQLQAIANRIEKKIKSELLEMLNEDRETYEAFWESFGLQLKYGVYNEFGRHKEVLEDLLLFYSSTEKKFVTLEEYVSRMQEGQEDIFYISGENVDKIDLLPQTEQVKEKGYEVLYLTDEIDEFALQVMRTYNEKKFKSIAQGDFDFNSEEEKQEIEKVTTKNKDLLEKIKESLQDKVGDVIVSQRLKSHPVCLSSGEGISLEMEKVLSGMPDNKGLKANKVLEINHHHPLFETLKKLYKKNPDKIDEYSSLLYDQALLIEGFPIEDPIAFSNKISNLMVEANK
jgi:Molecular chaperone, HSP90 family